MTTEREDLAREIFIIDNDSARDPDWEWHASDERNREYAYNIADGLLAAGYSKAM